MIPPSPRFVPIPVPPGGGQPRGHGQQNPDVVCIVPGVEGDQIDRRIATAEAAPRKRMERMPRMAVGVAWESSMLRRFATPITNVADMLASNRLMANSMTANELLG